MAEADELRNSLNEAEDRVGTANKKQLELKEQLQLLEISENKRFLLNLLLNFNRMKKGYYSFI